MPFTQLLTSGMLSRNTCMCTSIEIYCWEGGCVLLYDDFISNFLIFNRKPTSVGTAGSGKFELKNECYKEFNPYFYHYCRTDQSQVRLHFVFCDVML